jgi:phage terminase small subunit
MMTARQKKFCLEYANTGNATQSAINAGYAVKTARSQGQRLLTQEKIQDCLKQLAEEYASSKIATASEMQEVLTSIIRGEVQEEVIVIEGCGDGVSQAVTKYKRPSMKDVISAIDKLARMQGIYSDKNVLNVVVPVFSGEDDLED